MTESPTNATPREAEAIRKLALRLLTYSYPGAPAPGDVRLLPERLPDDLPVDLPLSDDSRLVGSLVRGRQEATIVIDSQLTAEQVGDFYRQQLLAAGWEEVPIGHWHGGFVPEQGLPLLFCRGRRGPALQLTATLQSDGSHDVRLQLTFDSRQSPCAQRDHEPPFERLIPQLRAPAGATQMPRGSGGGLDSWHTSATLTTDLELTSIAAHYDRQIESVGWTRVATGVDAQQAWSAWSFSDNDGQAWQGLLSIITMPQTPRLYFVQLYIAWADDDGAAESDWPAPVGIAWL